MQHMADQDNSKKKTSGPQDKLTDPAPIYQSTWYQDYTSNKVRSPPAYSKVAKNSPKMALRQKEEGSKEDTEQDWSDFDELNRSQQARQAAKTLLSGVQCTCHSQRHQACPKCNQTGYIPPRSRLVKEHNRQRQILPEGKFMSFSSSKKHQKSKSGFRSRKNPLAANLPTLDEEERVRSWLGSEFFDEETLKLADQATSTPPTSFCEVKSPDKSGNQHDLDMESWIRDDDFGEEIPALDVAPSAPPMPGGGDANSTTKDSDSPLYPRLEDSQPSSALYPHLETDDSTSLKLPMGALHNSVQVQCGPNLMAKSIVAIMDMMM